MSSGQKEAALREEEKAHAEHVARLQGYSLDWIASTLDKMRTEFWYLKARDLPLTRQQHDRLKNIESLLERLL